MTQTDGRTLRGLGTRASLVAAARKVLITEGFARASARTIADRANCSQATLFYHFPTVTDLLLAVLDEVSERRDAAFRQAIEEAHSPRALLRIGRDIQRADVASGDTRVLVELISGSTGVDGLAEQVRRRVEPWEVIAGEAAARMVPRPFRARINAAAVGHGLAALFLGLELLASLRPPEEPPPDVLAMLTALSGEPT